jgi:MPBQ/MSBQ methyltransferase
VNPVLDVGCGLGGLAAMIHKKNANVECLTPNRNQIEFINKTYPFLVTHNAKFENFSSETRYGTIINSESLQYIALDKAFAKANKLLLPGGKWIIADFFRLDESAISKSSQLLDHLHRKISEYIFRIAFEEDITLNVLPTLEFVHMLVPMKKVKVQGTSFLL